VGRLDLGKTTVTSVTNCFAKPGHFSFQNLEAASVGERNRSVVTLQRVTHQKCQTIPVVSAQLRAIESLAGIDAFECQVSDYRELRR